MAGSGTVLRQAAALGHRAIGFDLDPLAVLMSRVATDIRAAPKLLETALVVVSYALSIRASEAVLPWIDNSEETREFIQYWFAGRQRNDLRRLSYAIQSFGKHSKDVATKRALMLGLSRLIVTKQRGASLAWDVSHSRPHRVDKANEFDVLSEFVKSCQDLATKIDISCERDGRATVRRGDARHLRSVKNGTVDAIITSPPYLNAIDYLRGHRLSLVWLGYSLSDIRGLRSMSVGAERRIGREPSGDVLKIVNRICSADIEPGTREIIKRYARDLLRLTKEFSRVLKRSGSVHVVIGNSNLRGSEIDNAAGLIAASRSAGLELVTKRKRELPQKMRYLPVPKTSRTALGKRMRYEFVLSFRKSN
jgi:hypothetical protein